MSRTWSGPLASARLAVGAEELLAGPGEEAGRAELLRDRVVAPAMSATASWCGAVSTVKSGDTSWSTVSR